MSVFREISETHLLDTAEPLNANGSTCLCYKIKVYDRWQFMKRLHPDLENNSRYVSLFTKEFMVGSRLSHPNLVRYNEMETTNEGVFMLLDFVEGCTLAKILNNNPQFFSYEKHLHRFCIQTLECLQYLHSQQVLHLDLKPDNIMITRVNEDVKILDLGFCRTDCFTQSEGRSEDYAAPEQADFVDMKVDTRTDLYAFGRILEEIEKHLPSKNLPIKYKLLKKRCLEKDPAKRPQHASDCIDQLENKTRKLRYLYAGILLAVISLGCMFLLNDNWRNEFRYATRHFHFDNYNWIDNNCKIHILSDEEMTCEVVGHNKLGNNSLMVIAHTKFVGRNYQVTAIADSAFTHDSEMETIFLPEGLRSIGRYAFDDCNRLKIINLPNTVQSLDDSSFANCDSLVSIHLSESLRELPERGFHTCELLDNVVVPEGVTIIREDCFVDCATLSRISLPSTLSILERGVFYLCPSLENIQLPENLRKIGEYCFYECKNLHDVYCLATTPPQILSAFDRTDIRLHVPAESLELYKKDPEWSKLQILPL